MEDLIILPFVALVVIAFIYSLYAMAKAAKNAQKVKAALKAEYEASLHYLASHPEDPNARVNCMETGRKYFAMEIPDTADFHSNGSMSNLRNNAGARDQRILADIEARTAHLKFK